MRIDFPPLRVTNFEWDVLVNISRNVTETLHELQHCAAAKGKKKKRELFLDSLNEGTVSPSHWHARSAIEMPVPLKPSWAKLLWMFQGYT